MKRHAYAAAYSCRACCRGPFGTGSPGQAGPARTDATFGRNAGSASLRQPVVDPELTFSDSICYLLQLDVPSLFSDWAVQHDKNYTGQVTVLA